MPRYVIRPAADRDLDEQAGYLAEHASLEIARHDRAAATLVDSQGHRH